MNAAEERFVIASRRRSNPSSGVDAWYEVSCWIASKSSPRRGGFLEGQIRESRGSGNFLLYPYMLVRICDSYEQALADGSACENDESVFSERGYDRPK